MSLPYIPALRRGKAYESLDQTEVLDFRTGEVKATFRRVNAGVVRKDLQRLAKSVIASCLLLAPAGLIGHPGIDEQLARVSALIQRDPGNADLFLQRGEWHRLHAEYDKALTDFAEAGRLRPTWSAIALARARVFCDTGQTRDALKSTEEFLAVEGGHPEALVIRARCLARLNRAPDAVADYTAALGRIAKPSPDLFLERARTQAALDRFDDAIAGLDEGLARLGDVPSLQLAGIAYERQRANFEAALARVARLTSSGTGQETWLALQGEVLEQAGRLAQAREVFQKALAGTAGYSPARRGLQLTATLEERIRAGLTRVERRLALASKKIENHAP